LKLTRLGGDRVRDAGLDVAFRRGEGGGAAVDASTSRTSRLSHRGVDLGRHWYQASQGRSHLGVPTGLQPAVGVHPQPVGVHRPDGPAQRLDDFGLVGYPGEWMS
jgi:hypothetical protein